MSKYLVVVTDTTFSDLSIEREILRPLDAEVVDATPCKTEEEFITFSRYADALINQRRKVTRYIIESLPRLKMITRYAVGLDSIDIAAATNRGICVANVPDFCTEEVSDHAFGLLLACNRWIVRFDQMVRSGTYGDRVSDLPLQRLRGQCLGLIGFGRIARAVARKAQAFGLSVSAYDPYVPPEVIGQHGTTSVDLPTLLAQSDYVSIHVPITPETNHLIGESQLRSMKPTAYLINTARGAVVDVNALYKAIAENWIAGAGLDVVEGEPVRPDHPLLAFPNVIITPHVGAHSMQSLHDVLAGAAHNVASLLRGDWPSSTVNPEAKLRTTLEQ